MGSTDYITDSARQGYGLIKRSAQPLFIDLLKVSILGFLIFAAGILIVGAIFFAVLGSSLNQLALYMASPSPATFPTDIVPKLGIAGLASILIFIVISLLNGALNSVSYNIVENRSKDKDTGIIENFMKNLVPMIKFQLVVGFVFLILAIPLIASFALGGALVFCILMLLSLLGMILFNFFVQFGMIELILKKRGVINSLKSSYRIVRANVLMVILLDILLIVISMATGAVTGIARFIMDFVLSLFTLGGTTALLIGIAVYIVLLSLISIVVGTAASTVTLPIFYYFWKGKTEVKS